MEKTKSILSLKRDIKRNSIDTQIFKKQIEDFLINKPDYISYSIKRDLAVMTNMPFYKDRPKKIKIQLSKSDLLEEWIKIFSTHNDFEFISKLLKNLNRNQSQLLRKIVPKIGIKKDIWEHAIPTNFFVNELLTIIRNKDFTNLSKLINIYISAGQHSLTNKENELLKPFNSNMPSYWNWQDPNANPLERYVVVGIHIKEVD